MWVLVILGENKHSPPLCGSSTVLYQLLVTASKVVLFLVTHAAACLSLCHVCSLCVLLVQYDAAPIQPSVVLCSCASSSMVRTQLNSNLPHCLSMEVREGEASAQPKTSTIKPPQSRKKEDFSFGKILGEGSFSTVGTIFVLVGCMSEDFAINCSIFI